MYKRQVLESGQQEQQTLQTNGVFVYSSGSMPITEYLQGQIPLNKEGGVQVDENMKTTIDGAVSYTHLTLPTKRIV